MRSFELLEVQSVGEACQLLSRHGEEAKVLSGGTALVKLMKKRLVHPHYLVDLKGVRELHFIRIDREGLKIGALTTLREIETNALIREHFRPVAEMVHLIASVQIRNVGTLAGNLCLADPAADPAPLLIALGSRLKIAGGAGKRILPLEEFFQDLYQTALQGDEVVEEIQIPPSPQGAGISYLKHTLRAAFDLGIVGIATILSLLDGVCKDLKIVLGGVSTTPLRVHGAEDILQSKPVNEASIRRAAQIAAEEVDAIQDVRASPEYRKEIVEVLVGRGIWKALAQAQGRQG